MLKDIFLAPTLFVCVFTRQTSTIPILFDVFTAFATSTTKPYCLKYFYAF